MNNMKYCVWLITVKLSEACFLDETVYFNSESKYKKSVDTSHIFIIKNRCH